MTTAPDRNLTPTSEWTPLPWLAALLNVFVTPLGMLYVQRPWLALAYLLASLAAATASTLSSWAFGSETKSALLQLTPLLVSFTCAVHSFLLARRQDPTSRRAWYSRWYGLAVIPVLVFTFGFLVRSFLYEPFRIPSASMHPTIPRGSLVIVGKAGFGQYGTFGIEFGTGTATAPIARGDIVVHRSPTDTSTMHVTRVVGLPGDHVQYVDRQLTINGRAVSTRMVRNDGEYQYAIETLDGREFTVAFLPERPFKEFDQVIPPGQYVLLGDSRDNARDSRYGGLTRREDIIGSVQGIFPPRTNGQ